MCQTRTAWVANRTARTKAQVIWMYCEARAASSSAVEAVGEDSAEKREEHDGKLAEEKIEAEVEGIFGQVVDEPALRELLDEGADGGDTGAQPHDPEISVAEGSKYPGEKGRGFEQVRSGSI